MTQIPDAAVQAAKKAVFERCKKTYLTDDQMFAALTAAYPHLPLGFSTDDLAIVNRMAMRADEFDTADENGSWPDHQDAMATLGELRALRRVLSCLNGGASIDTLTNDDTKPVDVAAVREHGFDGKNHHIGYGYENQCHFIRIYPFSTVEEAENYIRALSAEPAQGEQWQPIETAPKGFEAVDLWLVHPSLGGERATGCLFIGGRWFDDTGLPFNTDWVPTHWMPLPAAPTLEEKA